MYDVKGVCPTLLNSNKSVSDKQKQKQLFTSQPVMVNEPKRECSLRSKTRAK